MKKTIREYYGWSKETKGEVGLEIEMEGSTLSLDMGKHWDLHEDGSLRPKGDPDRAIEYVLKKPVVRDAVSDALHDLEYNWAKHDSVLNPSTRCGVHVHINCQPLTILQAFNFASLYYVLEEPLVKWCGNDREGNLFCLRAKDAEYQIELMKECFIYDGITSNLTDNYYRYASMNLTSLRKFGSIEFRALRTPKSMDVIKTWVDLLLAVKDASLQFDHPKDLVSSVSANGPGEFLRQTLGDMGELIRCKGIGPMIMEGVRRVQEYAYAGDIVEKPAKAQTSFNIFYEPAGAPVTRGLQQAVAGAERTRWWNLQNGGRAPTEEEQAIYNRLLDARDRATQAVMKIDYTTDELATYRAAEREWDEWYIAISREVNMSLFVRTTRPR